MHLLYYVAVQKVEGDERLPKEIKNDVSSLLEENNFASDCNGFWGNSKADWFVIGGRWSGHLAEIKLDNFGDKARAMLKEKYPDRQEYGEMIDKEKEDVQALWESLGGSGINSWNREQGFIQVSEFGDDCMLLDEKLLKALKEDYKDGGSEIEVAVVNDGYVEDEMQMVDFLKREDLVGNYYIVVIDYHQ